MTGLSSIYKFAGVEDLRSLWKFVAVFFSVHNHFHQERSLATRDTIMLTRTALAAWCQFGAAYRTTLPALLRLVSGRFVSLQIFATQPFNRRPRQNSGWVRTARTNPLDWNNPYAEALSPIRNFMKEFRINSLDQFCLAGNVDAIGHLLKVN